MKQNEMYNTFRKSKQLLIKEPFIFWTVIFEEIFDIITGKCRVIRLNGSFDIKTCHFHLFFLHFNDEALIHIIETVGLFVEVVDEKLFVGWYCR